MQKASSFAAAVLLCSFAPLAQEPVAQEPAAQVSIAQAAAPPIGSWHGSLDLGIAKLRLVLHVTTEAGKLAAKLDSPDQGAKGIGVDAVSFTDGVLKFAIDQLKASYEGTFDTAAKEFRGTFSQGRDLPLVLTRLVGELSGPRRPQTPKEPFPYEVHEVFYSHDPAGDTAKTFAVSAVDTAEEGRVRLAATLTLPTTEGPHPAVVLISGSGAQDRDETLMGHKPFLVLADALTRRGIAVLRFDDRGTAASTGDHEAATSADFAKDAHAGLLYLRTRADIDGKKIGLMGHSEGGLIGPMVAAATDDVAFLVMLAGPGVNGGEIILLQSRLIGKAMGESDAALESGEKTNKALFALIRAGGDLETMRGKVGLVLNDAYDEMSAEARQQVGNREAFVLAGAGRLLTPWFRYFLTYEPVPTLSNVKCPVLALNGSLDLQVDPGQNLPPIRKALAANADVTIVELKGLNHLFQNCRTGAVGEYSQIEETFDPATLQQIGDWLTKRLL